MGTTPHAGLPAKRAIPTGSRTLGAVLAISAAAGLAAVITAGTASAAVDHDPGYVDVPSSNVTPGPGDWGRAWDVCRKQYPRTRSVEYRYTYDSNKPTKMQVWLCKES